jgi:hypothetical protein
MGDYDRMVNSRTLPLVAMLLLAACHGDSGGAPVADVTPHIKRPPPVKRGPTPEELTAGMVEAVTLGKSTVPVAVKFDLPQKPTAGQPAEVTIAVMPQIEADPATLLVTGSEALVLAPDSGPIEIPAVEPTQVYRHTIRLTPTAEGVQLLALSVSLKHDEITETRQFAVPIIVASDDAAAGSTAAISPGTVGPAASAGGAAPQHAGSKSP